MLSYRQRQRSVLAYRAASLFLQEAGSEPPIVRSRLDGRSSRSFSVTLYLHARFPRNLASRGSTSHLVAPTLVSTSYSAKPRFTVPKRVAFRRGPVASWGFFSAVSFLFFERGFSFSGFPFSFSGKRRERSPPSRFANCPAGPIVPPTSSSAPKPRALRAYAELIGFLPDEAARVSLSNLGRMFFTFGKIRSPWRAGTLADCAFNRVVSARLSHLPLLAWREIPQVFRSFVSRSCKQRFEKLEENGINRFR